MRPLFSSLSAALVAVTLMGCGARSAQPAKPPPPVNPETRVNPERKEQQEQPPLIAPPPAYGNKIVMAAAETSRTTY
jgi:glucose/arabinose dehydrogenase